MGRLVCSAPVPYVPPVWPPSCALADSFLGNRVDEGPLYVAHAVCPRRPRPYLSPPAPVVCFPGPRYIAGVFKPPCEMRAVSRCASHVPRFRAHTPRPMAQVADQNARRNTRGPRRARANFEGGDSSAYPRARISRAGARRKPSSAPVTLASRNAGASCDARAGPGVGPGEAGAGAGQGPARGVGPHARAGKGRWTRGCPCRGRLNAARITAARGWRCPLLLLYHGRT